MDQSTGTAIVLLGVGASILVGLYRLINTNTAQRDASCTTVANSGSMSISMDSAILTTTLASIDSSVGVSTSCGHDTGFSSHC